MWIDLRAGWEKGVSVRSVAPLHREKEMDERERCWRLDHGAMPVRRGPVAAGTMAQEKLFSGSGPVQVNDDGLIVFNASAMRCRVGSLASEFIVK